MKPRSFRVPLLASALFAVFSPVYGSTITWDGDTSTSWALGDNWVGGFAPADNLTTDVALFNSAVYSNQPDAGSASINGIQIGASSGTLAIGGTSLSIGSGGINVSSGAAATTIDAPITLGAAQAWTNNSANALTVGSISRVTGATVNFAPGAGGIKTSLVNTNGIIGGWATLGNSGGSGATADWATVDGNGNIVAYTGYTDISSGNQTGAGASTQNWRTVNTGAVTTLTNSATINSLVVRSDFSVSNGATATLESGGLILSGISRWILNNGAGNTTGTGQLTSGTSELFIDVASVTADANNWRIWTKIVDNGAGAVSMVKSGPGDVGLMNANTYTGGTYLNSGTLSLASSGSLGSGVLRMNGGSLNIRYAGANVNLANNIEISGSNHIFLGVARNLSLDGTISGRGDLTLGNSNHNSTIYLNGANTMTGGTITTANNTNSVRFSNAAAGNANVAWVFNNTSANRNTLDFTTGTISFGSLSGNGLLQANNSVGTKTISVGGLNTNSEFSGAIGGGSGVIELTKVGTGTQTFSGSNTYTGGTNINGGAIQINHANALGTTGTISFGGGTLKYGTVNTDLSARFSNVADQAYKVDTNGNDVAFASALTSSNGTFDKSGNGTLTLNGVNTYTGKTTVSGGSLALGSGGSIANSSEIALNGGNFSVSAVASFSTGITQTLTGNGGSITGDITVNGTLAIGNSPGTMTFNNDLTLGASSISNFEFTVGTFTPGSYDLALGGGGTQTVTFGGTLNLLFDSGETYANGSSVKIFDFETYDGNFDTLNFSGLGAGQSASFDFTTGIVTVIPEPGAALLGGLGMLALLRRRRN